MGNKQKGGAVFVTGTPKKRRAAKIRAALVGQLVFARLAIPRPDHIKAIVAELFHMLFFFFAPAGIFDGDNILVEQQSDASNGDMVVALIDDSATVKTYYKENGHIRLQPENDTMDPIIVPECEILGKVFGVFRFF